jgi:DNA-binding NtrC family response regulator
VIAATNIHVQNSIANKTFREDLYYRLAAFTINVPPLRERREEIAPLIKHMMGKLSESYGRPAMEMSPALLEACTKCDWPGNVRELGNFVKRLLVLRDESAAIEELQIVKKRAASASAVQTPLSPSEQRRNEANAIMRAMQQFNGNKRMAASSLKMSYNVFLQKEKEYNLSGSKRHLSSI